MTNFPHDFDTLITHVNIATFSQNYGFDYRFDPRVDTNNGQHTPYGQLLDSAITIKDGKITWIGKNEEAGNVDSDNVINANGQWLTAGLIDCHTHIVYGGNRSNEFEARLQGVSYKEISDNGGGINATIVPTREASFDELYKQSEKRLLALMAEGVTCIEIKSGYGLSLESERKILQVAKKLGEDYPITVKLTYLGAHAVPPEFKDMADGADKYIDKVCQWLPILHDEGLVDAVDGFCENVGFTREQTEKVFKTAQALNIPVKLHAEQLSDLDGSGLVAEYGGLSSDHLEFLSEKNVQHMAKSDTVAVLLPGAFYTLRETQLPPMDALRKHNVPIALSTDCNPGTSPMPSLLLALNMGCTLFRMTPEETLAGATIHASKALGLDDCKGRIEVGMDADLVLWDIDHPADLSYMVGYNPAKKVMIAGKWQG